MTLNFEMTFERDNILIVERQFGISTYLALTCFNFSNLFYFTCEPDRYIILGNIGRTLNNGEKNFESSNILMEVSKTLSELKMNEGKYPS